MYDDSFKIEVMFGWVLAIGITWYPKRKEIRFGIPFIVIHYEYSQFSQGIKIFGKEFFRRNECE